MLNRKHPIVYLQAFCLCVYVSHERNLYIHASVFSPGMPRTSIDKSLGERTAAAFLYIQNQNCPLLQGYRAKSKVPACHRLDLANYAKGKVMNLVSMDWIVVRARSPPFM